MGQTISKENESLNWDSIKTENGGSKQLSNDSKLLLNRITLNLPAVNNDNQPSSDVENIFTKYISSNLGSTNEPHVKSENEFSDTSPFINSEVYNNLINKTNNLQTGGNIDGDDSSTSSTSSSSDDKDKEFEDNKLKKKKVGKPKKMHKGRKVAKADSDSQDLSYVSSSAHTNGSNDSDTASVKSSSPSSPVRKVDDEYISSSEDKTSQSGGSITNQNEDLPPSSINTSDINMVTEN